MAPNTHPFTPRRLLWLETVLSWSCAIWPLMAARYVWLHYTDTDVIAMTVFTVAFAALAGQAVKLPSGAMLRPGLAIVLAGMLLMPPDVAAVIPIPGLLLAASIARRPWRDEALNITLVSFGLYIGGHVFRLFVGLVPPQPLVLLAAALAALAIHLLLNRFAATLLMTIRFGKPFAPKFLARILELGWSQVTVHTFAALLAAIVNSVGIWGLAVGWLPLYGLARLIAQSSQVPKLRQAALTDALTGVENRAAWEAYRQGQARGAFSGSIVMIDLDNFKAVNDTHGHAAGDALLQEFAATVRSHLRQTDRLFRYGGDEFILLVPHPPSATGRIHGQVAQLAHEVAAAWQAHNLNVAVSYGLATLPRDTDCLSEALQIADKRLYDDKGRHAHVR